MLKRVETIDIAKGISICAIVIGHVSSGILWDTTIIFATAAFFLLSGLTFYLDMESDSPVAWRQEVSFGKFLKKAGARLLFPYFVWGLISIIIYLGYEAFLEKSYKMILNNGSIVNNLLGLLYGNSSGEYFKWNRPLWFLPCLFVVELIAFIILRATEKNNGLQITAIIFTILLSLGWLYFLSIHESETFVWPFESETALAMLSYFMVGILIRRLYINGAEKLWGKPARFVLFIIGLAAIVTVIYVVSKRGGADTRSDLYRGFGWYLLGSWLGIIMVLSFSLAMTDVGIFRILSYVGKKTLAILVMHKFPIMFFHTIMTLLRFRINPENILVTTAFGQNLILGQLLYALVILALTLFFEGIISRFVPFLFGLRIKKD